MDQPVTARNLPEEFLALPGTPVERVLQVVSRHWAAYPEGERRQLAQALLTLLEPLLSAPAGTIPAELRAECERLVQFWGTGAARGRPVSPRMRQQVSDDLPSSVRGAVVPVGDLPIPPSSIDAEEPMGDRPPRLLKFARAQLERLPDERCRLWVQLERPGQQTYEGEAFGNFSGSGVLQAAARAAAEALRRAVGKDQVEVEVSGAEMFQGLGVAVAMVSLVVRYQNQTRALLGFCPEDQRDPLRAAAVAVLNATNRFLGVG
ncbi:MAG: hypothetical protein HY700_08730 [Gemmatimonadetes bacterium]|nr:hypothetical protein [Gemmatimonadota bacterium]